MRHIEVLLLIGLQIIIICAAWIISNRIIKNSLQASVFNYLDGIIVINKKYKLINMNRGIKDILKKEKAFKLGVNIYKLMDRVEGKSTLNFIRILIKMIESNGQKSVCRKYIELDGEAKFYEIDLEVSMKGYYIITLRDITNWHWKIIDTLIKTIGAKDNYTLAHSYRVAEYSVKMGEKLGLSKDTLMMIRTCALSHDIGKIGVSDSVLNSTERFSADSEQMKEMRRHTIIGYEILKDIEEFKSIAEIVRYHHERIDGKGYEGLTGDQIPPISKILAVADTFDAMSSGRVYGGNKVRQAEDIIKDLETNSAGTQLDSRCLQALKEHLIDSGVIIRNRGDADEEGINDGYSIDNITSIVQKSS